MTAPMPGRITQLMVEPGMSVQRGQPLMIIEAMKMEHTVVAPADGIVEAVWFSAGDQVEEGTVAVLCRCLDNLRRHAARDSGMDAVNREARRLIDEPDALPFFLDNPQVFGIIEQLAHPPIGKRCGRKINRRVLQIMTARGLGDHARGRGPSPTIAGDGLEPMGSRKRTGPQARHPP